MVKSPNLEIGFAADDKVKQALEILKKLLGVQNFKVSVKSTEIPPASGIGSSAAFGVAAIRALSNEFKLGLTDRQVCDFAFETEKIFHGNPSGIDNVLATFGGSIVFQRRPGGNLIRPLRISRPIHSVRKATQKL